MGHGHKHRVLNQRLRRYKREKQKGERTLPDTRNLRVAQISVSINEFARARSRAHAGGSSSRCFLYGGE